MCSFSGELSLDTKNQIEKTKETLVLRLFRLFSRSSHELLLKARWGRPETKRAFQLLVPRFYFYTPNYYTRTQRNICLRRCARVRRIHVNSTFIRGFRPARPLSWTEINLYIFRSARAAICHSPGMRSHSARSVLYITSPNFLFRFRFNLLR